jgi:hypothetical protein
MQATTSELFVLSSALHTALLHVLQPFATDTELTALGFSVPTAGSGIAECLAEFLAGFEKQALPAVHAATQALAVLTRTEADTHVSFF